LKKAKSGGASSSDAVLTLTLTRHGFTRGGTASNGALLTAVYTGVGLDLPAVGQKSWTKIGPQVWGMSRRKKQNSILLYVRRKSRKYDVRVSFLSTVLQKQKQGVGATPKKTKSSATHPGGRRTT